MVTLCCKDWINWFQESKIRAFVNYHWHSLGPHIICSPGAYKVNHTVTTNVVYFWISVTVSRIHSIQLSHGYLSRMGQLYEMSPGPHLICHAWESCMEWVLDPILSVTHGKAVWNESWTPSYLSRMWKLYGMSPGPHLICHACRSC
jgi:hypothetical protein